nr:PLDc N-terminal domain-containing protein [Gemmatimonadaceae bacterium]
MNSLSPVWQAWIGAAIFAADVVASLHVVLRKRDSRAATAWVGVIWLVPGIGVLLYAFFGVNRIRRRGTELQRARAIRALEAAAGALDPEVAPVRPRLTGLARVAERVSGRPLLAGNAMEPLLDGDAAYPAMLAAMERAQHSISLCSYLFAGDAAGRQFVAALSRAVTRGVDVRVLIDDVGVRYDFPPVHWALRRAGVPVALFLPIISRTGLAFFNLRTHRKVLVIDGSVAFAGGMNLQARNIHAMRPRHAVRDVHFRIAGPVVTQLQVAFAEDWAFATRELLEGPRWFPPVAHAGTIAARAITGGPDLDFEVMRSVLLAAISSARESVRIVTPYFLPDAPTIAALSTAALRGVRVDIVLPEHGNVALAQWASRATLWQVLRPGCHVHLTPRPFDHSKLFVIDRSWALVGTTNWDSRSLRLNFELDVEAYDEAFAGVIDDLARDRIARSREFTLADADGRPFVSRVRDGFARLLSP